MCIRDRDIDLHFEINDLSEVAIPSVDLTVVMSNLLDNAIEACEKLEKQQRRMTCLLYTSFAFHGE